MRLFIFKDKSDASPCIYSSDCDFLSKEIKNGKEYRVYKASVSGSDIATLESATGPRVIVLVANYDFGNSGNNFTYGSLNKILSDNRDLNSSWSECVQSLQAGGLPMYGESDITFNYSNSRNIGTVSLSRSVSKISVVFPKINLKDYIYDIDNVSVSLRQYASKGYVSAHAEPVASDPKVLQSPSFVSFNKVVRADKSQIQYPLSFYSYPVKWSNSSDQIEVIFKVPFRRVGDLAYKDYYYSAKIYDSRYPKSIVRNVCYELVANINKLGSEDPNNPLLLKDIDVSIALMSWIKGQSVLQGYKYLYLRTNNLNLVREEADVEVISSSKITKITVSNCYSKFIEEATGNEKKMVLAEDDPIYPKVTLDATTNVLHINSPTPDNYLIKYFDVVVQNQQGMQTTLNVRHYPPYYVKSEFLNGTAKPPTYTVRTLYSVNLGQTVTAFPATMNVSFYRDRMNNLPKPTEEDPYSNVKGKGSRLKINGQWVDPTYPIVIPQQEYQGTISPNFEIEYKKVDYADNKKDDNADDNPGVLYFAKYAPPHKYGTWWAKWESIFYPLNDEQKEDFEGLKLNYNWFYFASPDYLTGYRVGPVGDYAVLHCLQLHENGASYHSDGTDQISWRLPTSSELLLIKNLILDKDSEYKSQRGSRGVSFLSKGLYWDAAAGYHNFGLTQQQVDTFIEKKQDKYGKMQAYVRCVRDIRQAKNEW